MGRRSFLMTPLHEYHFPRHRPSMFVQPRIDLATVRSLMPWRRKQRSEMADFARMVEDVSARDLGIPLNRGFSPAEDLARIRSVAAFSRRQLDRLRPAAAFVVSYYSLDGMAFNLACREAGVVSADIQHGVEGDLNAAYGQWSRLPATGYALLPNLFWCWTEGD